MRSLSSAQAYRMMGLSEAATSDEIHAAFRALAKRHHPDVNRAASDHRRFARMIEAYHLLCQRLHHEPKHARDGRCPRCGVQTSLCSLLDGRRGCADCLFGRTRMRRLLPGPVRVAARHIPVFLLCGVAVGLIARYLRTEDLSAALLALGSVWLGFGILTTQVLTIVFDNVRPGRPRPSPSRAALAST